MITWKTGDWVRVMNPEARDYNQVGRVESVAGSGKSVEVAFLDQSGTSWFDCDSLDAASNVTNETVRGGVLLEAKTLIEGDRNITYGEPTQNFANIAGMWNILFAHKLTEDFTSRDVAQAMIALKQCRTITQPKRDNFVDIAGYAAIGWEAEESSS